MTRVETRGTPSPWHAGEKQLQEKLGVAERMESFGRRAIRDFMPEQHRIFYSQLPFLLVGSVDAEGRPWASLLEGPPGFAHAPHERLLQLDRILEASDPARAGLFAGAAIGLLGIELHTRRRNRLNGRVRAVVEGGFSLEVEHAFGNCPQYIQRRELSDSRKPEPNAERRAERLATLDAAARATITAADTFFVASYVDIEGDPGRRSVDVSHRGGRPGFVRIDGDSLTIPDFAGNLHFNTLGNLLVNPRAGLVFLDFQTGDILQVSGRTEIVLESPEIEAYQGAERFWRLHVEAVVRRSAATALRFELREPSPNNSLTGSWKQAQARLEAMALRESWRPFRVTHVEDVSASVRSFHLEPADTTGIPGFRAGQHLPIRVRLPGADRDVIRTYSLSSAPSDAFFRISVKRIGAASNHLQDRIRVGDLLEIRAPRGGFVVDPSERRPLVLLSAGVGVTPLLSMLREVLYEGARIRRTRRSYFVQSARTLAELPFRDEVGELAARHADSVRVVRVLSQPEPQAQAGIDFDAAGRIDMALLKTILPFDDFDFYLCGPASFTQDLYDALRDHAVRDDRIHAESFGPASLRRRSDRPAPASVLPAAEASSATAPVRVVFAKSGKEARWTPESGSLLELAESRGLTPEFSCRGGSCGTCQTRLLQGEVCYSITPADRPPEGQALICCAVPAAPNHGGTDGADRVTVILDL